MQVEIVSHFQDVETAFL